MPLYEYHCGKCGCDFEELVMGEAAKIKCPSCGSARVKKLMSAFAHHAAGRLAGGESGSGCSGCSSGNCSSCGR